MSKKTQNLSVCCLQETHFRFKDTHRLKVNIKKLFYANSNQERSRVAIFIPENRL